MNSIKICGILNIDNNIARYSAYRISAMTDIMHVMLSAGQLLKISTILNMKMQSHCEIDWVYY